MKIELGSIEKTVINQFKGGEGSISAAMFVDELNRIMLGELPPGASIGMHLHEQSSEIIFCISGEGVVVCDGVAERLAEGDCHYCKKGSSHTLKNESDKLLRFYAVVPQQ